MVFGRFLDTKLSFSKYRCLLPVNGAEMGVLLQKGSDMESRNAMELLASSLLLLF